MTVLVVDDQAPFRVAARALVERTPGFVHVASAVGVQDAVALAGVHAPDLVLLDVRLPDGSGADAVASLHAVAPRAVVVLCSTYDRADLPLELDRCGAAAFIRKESLSPVALAELWRAHGSRPAG